ncbi:MULTISPECIES: AI-2E family transporter [Rhizobium]|uniref:AI-2E family transporter n=1 Tax=Rhizobium wuzhouense TaxID=1986026 RepID=A0ABX5NY51_9HYPH|nr:MULTISPECIES: AI-2E family transporter [Rhizobium]PYB77269.1 AI-2E family transporter [Rhizobium wuzhouense]RKE85911.1 putative PurR-regulated permease PerM [Rhizobium sp. AG855]
MNLQVQPKRPAQRRVRFQKTGLDYTVSWSVIGLFAIFALISLHLASFVLIPLTMAIVVGLILGLAADRMGKLGIPPMLTAVILSTLFLGVLGLLVFTIAGPINMLIENGPKMVERAIDYLEGVSWLRRPIEALSSSPVSPEAMLQNSGTILSTLATGVTPALLQIFIFVVALLLFLASRLTMRRALIRAFSHRDRRLKAIHLLNEVEAALGHYFATAVVVYALFGAVAGIIAWVGGLGSPLLWAVGAFLLSFIPFLGIASVTIAMMVGGVLAHESLLIGLLPAIVFFAVDGLLENLLLPAAMGRRLEMNTFMLFVAIVFWTWLWGAVGAMLAVPLTLIGMTLFGGILPQARPQPNLPD